MSWLISFLRTLHETRQVFGCVVGMCFVVGYCWGLLFVFCGLGFVGFCCCIVVLFRYAFICRSVNSLVEVLEKVLGFGVE